MNHPIAIRPSWLTPARRALAVVGLAVLAAFLVSPAPAAADTWHASGQVTYSDGTPAANATVHLTTASGAAGTAQTDSSGNYSVSVSESGSSAYATLWATYGGCSSQPQQVMDRDITSSFTISGTPGSC